MNIFDRGYLLVILPSQLHFLLTLYIPYGVPKHNAHHVEVSWNVAYNNRRRCLIR